MRNAPVADLAAAITDGQDIDWAAAQARLTTPDDIHLVQALHTLSGLSAVQPALPRSAVRQLPVLLRIARWIAIPFVVLGVIGLVGVLATRGVTGIGLIMLALTVAFAAAAVVVDIGSTDTRARALAAVYWMLAASVSANGMTWLLLQWLGPAWFVTVTGVRPEAFFAAALWAFAREFPSLTVQSAVDRVCSIGLRVALVVGSGLFVANLLPGIGLTTTASAWVGPFVRFAQGPPFYWLPLFATAVPALAALLWRARLSVGHERQRARLFLLAIATCISPLVVEVVVDVVFPPFTRLMDQPGARIWGQAIVYPPLLLLPSLTAYAVVKTDVLTLRVILHRGLCYLLARWLLTWGTVVPAAALGWHLYVHADQPLAHALALWPGRWLALASVIGIVGLSLRARFMRALDRWLLTSQEQPAEMLATMTERLKNARTPIEVITEFSDGLERSLQATAKAYVLVSGAIVPLRSDRAPGPAQSMIPILLRGSGEPCPVAQTARRSYHALLSEGDRAWIEQQQIAVVVPVLAARGQRDLLGIIALGQRRNAAGYTDDDYRLLRAGAAAAGLACDAIRPDLDATSVVSNPVEEMAAQCVGCGLVQAWTDGPCPCGGTRVPAALPQRVAGRFELLRRLGAGGMGVVYQARDSVLNRDVAIKTLPRLTQGAAERLLVEAQTMAGLAHAHVAVLYAAETWQNTPLLIMELMNGGTLADRIRRGALPVEDAAELASALAITLEHVHASGRFHGDIKPSNIGFAGGVAKFLDFGLSRVVATPSTDHDREPDRAGARPVVAGTIAYMPPDVRAGADAGPQMDVWALTLVLYECVLGSNPLVHVRSSLDVSATLTTALSRLPSSIETTIGPVLRSVLLSTGREVPTAAGLAQQLVAALRRSRSIA